MATTRLAETANRSSARARLAYATAGVAVGAILLSACGGSRLSDAEVIKAESGGAVTATAEPGMTPGMAAPNQHGTAMVPGSATAQSGGTAPVAGTQTTAALTGGAANASSGSAATGPKALNTKSGSTASDRKIAGAANASSGSAAAGLKAGGETAASGTAAMAACTTQGPPIVLGQVVEYSGIIGATVGLAIPVLGAWVKYVNAQGGIACHPVQVISQDDASDPSRAAAEVRDLVENRKAIGLVANFIPLSISGFKSVLDKVGIAAVGGDLFSTTWWTDPLFYPVGTHVDANAFGSTAAVAKTGANKVAVIYCIEGAVCPPYKDAVKRYANQGGYQVVYDVQVSITAPDYTSQCQSAKNAGATQINMIVEGSGVSRIARSCAAIGYFPKFAVASLGSAFDTNDKNVQKMTVTIASAAADWYSIGSKGQQQFQEAMERYAPSVKLSVAAPLAWADAMMIKAAIEKLGAKAVGIPITAAMLREGLALVKNETLDGMVKPTSFSPTQGVNPGNPCYFADVFSAPGHEGKWSQAADGCLKGLDAGSDVAGSSSLDRTVPSAEEPPNLLTIFRSRERG